MPSGDSNHRCGHGEDGDLSSLMSRKCPCHATILKFNCQRRQKKESVKTENDQMPTPRRKPFQPGNDDEAKIRNYYGEEDVSCIDELMKMHDASVIREKMFAVQERLYAFHVVADAMEKFRAENERLEEELANEEVESAKREEKLKTVGDSKIESLEEEMIQLKLELADSRGKEDHFSTEIRKLSEETKQIGQLAQALRVENAKLRPQRSSSVAAPGVNNIASFFGFAREEGSVTVSPKRQREKKHFEAIAQSFKMESAPRRNSLLGSGPSSPTRSNNDSQGGVANFFGFSNIKARTVGCEKKTEKVDRAEPKQIRIGRRHSLTQANPFKKSLWGEIGTPRHSTDASDDMSTATCPNPADAAAGGPSRSSRHQEKSRQVAAR